MTPAVVCLRGATYRHGGQRWRLGNSKTLPSRALFCACVPLSRGIGSDSQRPFAIVIVGGLLAALFISIYLLPEMYVWAARESDKLPLGEAESEEPV
jgi:hypothetical protein